MFKPRTISSALLLTTFCLLTTSATADIIYVDDDAPTGGDGLSWQTAYTDLQDAITHASTNGAVTRIHVAKGTYTPDPGGTNRDAAFTMINGVAICGGYAGLSAPADPNQRDISDHETILSGNIGNPDYQSDNSYHLFYHYDGLGLDHTAILDGFTLANANADGAAPNDSGAAIYNYANSPTIIRCLFIDNRAVSYGGAIYNFGLSNPTIFNCRFVHNQALQGAGLWNHGCTDLLVCGSTFQNNIAVLHGGATWNYGGSPTFINSTFYGNSAATNGGGMRNSLTSPTVTNSIFWANTSPEGSQISNSSTAYPEITYCCVQDGFSGTGNISTDPGITTLSPRLPSDSPCIDAGSNDALPSDTYDLDGDGNTAEPHPLDLQNWPRVIQDPVFHNTTPGLPPIVDMGAYEFASDCNSNSLLDLNEILYGSSPDCNYNHVLDECEPGGLLDCNANTIPDLCDLYTGDSPDCNYNFVPDECDLLAGTSYDCNDTAIPDECEIESGDSPDCNSNQSPDECDLANETSPDCNQNETPDECDIISGASQDCNSNQTPDECEVLPTIFHVDDDATTGLNDGSTWDNAFVSLREAIDQAYCNDDVTEIRIAQGQYVPGSERINAFRLKNGVAILGGYRGNSGDGDPNDRDPKLFLTVLSGDISGDDDPSDSPDFAHNSENSYHVIYNGSSLYLNATAVLDGVTIARGNSEGSSVGSGAGIYNSGGNRPTISNCVFVANAASGSGGAVRYGSASGAILAGCTFVGNHTENAGGAVYSYSRSTLKIASCTFSGNRAGSDGGAISNGSSSELHLINTTFTGNCAGTEGGAIYNSYYADSLDVVNCIFSSNMVNGEVNHIADDSIDGDISFSCLHGQSFEQDDCPGCIDANPGFLSSGYWDDNSTPEEYADDLWISGDYHLAPDSPCLDVGDNDSISEDYPFDIDGEQRMQNCTVDMGSDEASYYGDCNNNGIVDACDITLGTSLDCQHNRIPDECDINLYGSEDDNTNAIPDECEPDCNSNGLPDDMDLASGLGYDANSNGMLDECEIPIFVDDSATNGLNDGRTWTDAYLDLQDALDEAAANSKIREIRVAQGLYLPDRGTGDVEVSFEVPGGVALLGGYAGVTATDPNTRDYDAYQTILSGALTGNHTPDDDYDVHNSRVVVRLLDDTIDTSIIEGLTVEAGIDCGLRSTSANTIIRHCRFLYCDVGAAIGGPVETLVTDCVFERNGFSAYGKGLSIYGDTSYVRRCEFVDNVGACLVPGEGADIIECRFADNNSLAAIAYRSCSFNSCLFLRNQGGLRLSQGQLALTSCLFSGNSSDSYSGAIFGDNSGVGEIIVSGCTLANNERGIYVNCRDKQVTVENSILWNNTGTGYPSENNQVFVYEGTLNVNYSFVQGWTGNIAGEHSSGSDPLFVDLDGPDDIPGNEDDDLHLLPDSPAINAGDPSYIVDPQETDFDGQPRVQHCRIDIGADETPYFYNDCNNNGISDFCDLADPETYDLNGDGVVDSCERTLFVNQNVSGGTGTGDNWANAFTDLQDALAEAHADSHVRQIWVAAGTYMPDSGTGDQTISFDLRSGLFLYGGFAGYETSLQQRDITTNPTILSGDLNGDDDLGFSNIQDNSYHVLTAVAQQDTITVDGFTIQGGGTSWDSSCLPDQCYGGGLYALYSPLVAQRCRFHHNHAVLGGAIYAEGASTTLIGCRIEQNETRSSGAGGLLSDTNVSIFNCRFTENVAQGFSSGALGIRAYFADEPISAVVANSIFINNGGPHRGGSISVAGSFNMDYVSSFLLANCTIVGGFAEQCGGVFAEGSFDATIQNSLFWGNTDTTQDVMDQQLGFSSSPYGLSGSISVDHSCIQGWDKSLGGHANTNANPRFANLAGLDSVLGTADDDVSLAAGSPCIDAGSNGLVPLDLYDLDSDSNTTEPLPFDLDGQARFFDDPMAPDTGAEIAPIVDIGAIEYQQDCNSNGITDSIDLFQGAADCDSNGVLDECQIDCNADGQADACQILDDPANDCNINSILDACEYNPDCNSNGILDLCELDFDCNTNGIPDECELGDNNENDLNLNAIPDDCEEDCNKNGNPDDYDIASAISPDCNDNAVPDECDIASTTSSDCNNDAIPDECQLQDNDCNANNIPDECDVIASPMSFVADNYLAGHSFSSLQAADVNGDGYADLIALDSDNAQAIALVNDTTGNFAQTNGYPIGTNPAGLIVTDLSNDGLPDLVVFDQGQSDPGIYVSLNTGNGTFDSPTGYATGVNANDLAVGSIDGDGPPDLVVANNLDRTVAIFYNYGDGLFANRRLIGTGSAPVDALKLSDLDNDGDLDIITYPKTASEQQATILINTENGPFTDLIHLQLNADRVQELHLMDLNNDNLPELVVIHQYGTNVYVFENLGNCTFAPSTAYPIANWPRALGFADLNGDGFLDITVGSLAQFSLAVLINAQDGTFFPTEYYTSPDALSLTIAADLDGDRDIDIAGANSYGSTLSVLTNNGTGSLSATYSFATGRRPLAMTTADADNDGKPDIFTASGVDEGLTSLLNQTMPPLDPDYNANGLLDQCEIAMFHDCLSGPTQTPTPTDHTPEQCLTNYDYDNNGNIDLLDFARFQKEFTAG